MADLVLAAYPYGSVLFASEVPCIITQWHSFANRQQFQSMMNEALEQYKARVQQTRPLGWLADTRHMSALTPDDQQWLNTDWNLRAYAAGIRHISIVQAENVFGKIAADNYSARTLGTATYSLEPSTHATLAEAKRWLKLQLQTLPSGTPAPLQGRASHSGH